MKDDEDLALAIALSKSLMVEAEYPTEGIGLSEEDEDVDVLDYGETYTHPSDDDDSFAALPSFSSYTNAMPPATVASSLPKFGDSAEHLLRSAQHRLRRFLSDTTAAVRSAASATRTPPSQTVMESRSRSLPQLLETLGELAVAATTETPGSAALSLDARLYLSILVHATAAAAVVLPFAGEVDGCSLKGLGVSAGSGTCNYEDDVLDQVNEIKSLPPMMPLVKMARFSLRTLEVALSPTPTAQSTSTTGAEQFSPSPQQSTAECKSLSKTASVGSEAARYSMATLALLATHVELAQTVTVDALRKACAGLEEATAELLEVDGGGIAHSATAAAIETLAASAPLQESLARLYSFPEEEEEDFALGIDISGARGSQRTVPVATAPTSPDRARGSNASAAIVSGTSAYSSCTPISEYRAGHEAAALVAALQQLQTTRPTDPTPGAAASESSCSVERPMANSASHNTEWVRRMAVSQLRSQVASALRAADGPARLAGVCTSLLLPLDLRTLVLSHPGSMANLYAQGDDDHERLLAEEHEDAASATLDLCSALMELHLAMPSDSLSTHAHSGDTAGSGRRVSDAGGFSSSLHVDAYLPHCASRESPSSVRGLAEHLCMLRALLYTVCLSSNLPTGVANTYALGRLVGGRLAAIVHRGLIPTALRLVRREATLIGNAHAAPNAHLCATAALSWALGASVPLSALFDPAGALGAAWPVRAAAGPDSAHAAWQALRNVLPLAGGGPAVSLLLRCARLLIHSCSPFAASTDAAIPSRHEEAASNLSAVPVRLAGGFFLSAEAPCSAKGRLEALFALPGFTLLDSLLGLTLATSLRPNHVSGESSALNPGLIAETALTSILRCEGPSKSLDMLHTANSNNGVPAAQSDLLLSLLRFLSSELLGPHAALVLAPLVKRSLATRHVRAVMLLLQMFEWEGEVFTETLSHHCEIAAALALLAERIPSVLSEEMQEATLRAGFVTPFTRDCQFSEHLATFAAPLRLPVQLLRFYAHIATSRLTRRVTSRVNEVAMAEDVMSADVVRTTIDALAGIAASAGATTPGATTEFVRSPLTLPHAQLLLLLWHSLAPRTRRDLANRLASAIVAAVITAESTHLASVQTPASTKMEATAHATIASWRIATLRLLQLLDYFVTHPGTVPAHLPAQLQAQLFTQSGGEVIVPAAVIGFDLKRFDVIRGAANAVTQATVLRSADMYELCGLAGDGAVSGYEVRPTAGELPIATMHAHLIDALWSLLGQSHASDVVSSTSRPRDSAQPANHKTASAEVLHLYHVAWRLLGSVRDVAISVPPLSSSPLHHACTLGQAIHAARRVLCDTANLPAHVHSGAWLASAAKSLHNAVDVTLISSSAAVASAHALAIEQTLTAMRSAPTAAATFAAEVIEQLRLATSAAASSIVHLGRASSALEGRCPLVEALVRASNRLHTRTPADSVAPPASSAVESLIGGEDALRKTISIGSPSDTYLRWVKCCESDLLTDECTTGEERLLRLLTAHLVAPEIECSAGGHCEQERDPHAGQQSELTGSGRMDVESSAQATWEEAAERAAATRRASEESRSRERRSAIARLQLTLHSLLSACAATALALAHPASPFTKPSKPPSTMPNIKVASEMTLLGQEALQLAHDPWFGFCSQVSRSAAAAALPDEALRYVWSDLIQLRKLHAVAAADPSTSVAWSDGEECKRVALSLELQKLESLLGCGATAATAPAHALLFFRGVQDKEDRHAPAISPRQSMKNLSALTSGIVDDTRSAPLGAPAGLASLLSAAPAGNILDMRAIDVALLLLRMEQDVPVDQTGNFMESRAQGASDIAPSLSPRGGSLAQETIRSVLSLGGQGLESWISSRCTAAFLEAAAAATSSSPAASTAPNAASRAPLDGDNPLCMAPDRAPYVAVHNAGLSISSKPTTSTTIARDVWLKLVELFLRLAVGRGDGADVHATLQCALRDRLWPILQAHLDKACLAPCAAIETSSSPMSDVDQSTANLDVRACGLADADTQWAAWGSDAFRLMVSIAFHDAEGAGGTRRLEELVHQSLRLLDKMREPADAPSGPILEMAATDLTQMEIEGTVSATTRSGRRGAQCEAACALLRFLGEIVSACEVDSDGDAQPSSKNQMLVDPPSGLSTNTRDGLDACDDQRSRDSRNKFSASTPGDNISSTIADSSRCVDIDEADADVGSRSDTMVSQTMRARQLACRTCTFATTGSNFTEQHWYYCYTCGLTQSEGCCSICIRVCHAGHVVSYSRRSRFFCDCGAGGLEARGVRCLALRPRLPAASREQAQHQPTIASALHVASDKTTIQHQTHPKMASSNLEPTATLPTALPQPPALLSESRMRVLRTMGEASFVRVVFSAYRWLRDVAAEAEQQAACRTSTSTVETVPELFPPGSSPKPIVAASDLAATRAIIRPGSFDTKPRFDAPHARDTRTLVAAGANSRQLVAATAAGLLMVVEGERLHVYDGAASLALSPPPSSSPAPAVPQPGYTGGSAHHSYRLHTTSAIRTAAISASTASSSAASATNSSATSSSGTTAHSAAIGTHLERSTLRLLSKIVLGFEAVSIALCPIEDSETLAAAPAAASATAHVFLLVTGLRSCIILSLGSRGEVISRIPLDVSLDSISAAPGPPALLRACWLPSIQKHNSPSGGGPGCIPAIRCVAMLTSQWVKILDVSSDRPALLRHYHLLDDNLKDIAFASLAAPNQLANGNSAASSTSDCRLGGLTMFVMGSSGTLYTQALSLPLVTQPTSPSVSPTLLTIRLSVPSHLHARLGSTLYFSQACNLLFTSYSDGRVFALRLNTTATEVSDGFPLHPTPPALPSSGGGISSTVSASAPSAAAHADPAVNHGLAPAASASAPAPAFSSATAWRMVPHSHWQDVPGCPGLLLAACRKTLQAMLLCVTATSVDVQPLRPSGRVEGLVASLVATFGTSSSASNSGVVPVLIWALHDDGSLVCHQPTRPPLDSTTARAAALRAALHTAFSRRTPQGTRLSFPVDAFERGVCITSAAEITLALDASFQALAAQSAMRDATIGTGNTGSGTATAESERLKACLSAASDEHLSGSAQGGGGLTICVTNSSPTLVPTGVRVLVGATHPQRVPASITIFNRTIPTIARERRWYDLPFTKAESVAGLLNFTVTFSAVHPLECSDHGAQDRNLSPILNAFEIFGISKSEFGLDAITRALEVKHLPPSPDERLTSAGAPPRLMSALETALAQLRVFHIAAAGGAAPATSSVPTAVGLGAPEREQMLDYLPRTLLPDGCFSSLRKPTKALLRILEPRCAIYHEVKDRAMLRHSHAVVSLLAQMPRIHNEQRPDVALRLTQKSAAANATEGGLPALLPGLCKILRKRPHGFLQFLRGEPEFLTRLCAAAQAMQAEAHPIGGSSGSSVRQSVRQAYQSVVHILLTCASHLLGTPPIDGPLVDDAEVQAPSSSSLDALRPLFEHLICLLLSSTEAVRIIIAAAVSRALLAPPNSNGLGGNTAGSTRVLGWGRTSTPSEAAPSGQPAIADDLLHAQEEALSVLGTSNSRGGAYRDLDVEEADDEEEEEGGGEDGEEEEEGFLVDPADTMDEEGGEEEEDIGISLAMDIDGAPESRGGPAHELEAEDQDGVSDGGEGEEDAMLAMALAMSLQQARQDGVLNEGDVPASATCESASPTSIPPDAEAAALESARAARRRQRYLVHCIRTLLLEYLPNLTGRQGITCIPFMQLLLQLSSTNSKFSDFNPATAPALSQTLSPLVVANSVAVDDTEQAILWGRRIADMLSDQLATLRSLDLSCRSIEMEQAILKILLLCLLLHNEKRSASLGTLATPRVATLAGSSVAGPAATEASATACETHIASAMASALASRLMARGICSLLHNLTYGLYVHFTAEGPQINDDDVIANVVASTAPSASRLHMPVHRSRTARHAANLHAGTSPHSSRILAPFFSDAYGKAHQHDLFEEANQLLLDAVLRLGQRLVQRGVPTSAFKAGQGIESIPMSWSSLLCRIIHSPSLSFARKQAKKLLHVMCGSKTAYAEVRDRGLASLELDNVRRILGVSAASPRPDGGSEQSLEHGYLWDSGHDLPPPPLTYESQLELSASLRKLHEAASAQPMNWVRFCAGDDGMTDSLLPTAGQETLAFLLRVAFVLRADASLIYVMKLLVLALGMPVPNTDTKASDTSASPTRVHLGLDVRSLLRGIPLVHFVRVFALRASVAGVRSEACSVMRALWARAQQSADRLALFAAVATALPSFPLHGAACHELMEFLGDILLSSDSSLSTSPGSVFISPSGQCPSPLSPATIREVLYALVRSFREQIALLRVHPNAQLYAALGGLIELDAHHLESVSYLAASRPESTPTLAKLESLRAETKFSESCQLVQLSACQSLHGGAVRIIEARRSMLVSCIRLYVNNQPVSDIGELKNQWGRWKRVKSLHVAPGQTDVRFDFAVPVVATNVLIEYAAFHENPAGCPEKLLCPRCSRSVADRHGICKNCGDNAYQCRHCRNINYEKLDAYLCNECGFCKHARFQWSFSVQPSFAVEPISSEADRARLQSLIDAELRAANRRLEQLDTHRRAITRLLASPHDPLVLNELSGAVAIPGASRGSATASGGNANSITTSAGTAAGAASSSSAAGDALMAVLPNTAAALQLKPRLYLAATLYAKEAQASHDALFRSAQTLQAARAELLRYVTTGDAGADGGAVADETAMEVEGEGSYNTLESQLIRDPASPPQSIIRNCRYDSGSAFVLEVLSLFERLCDGSDAMRDELLAQRIDEELFRSCLTNAPRRTQARAVRLLCLLSRDSAVATKRLNSELGRRLELCVSMHDFLPHERLLEAEVGLLCQLCRLQDSLWPERLAFMFRVLARGVEHLDSSHICRRLLLPCLRLVIEIVKGDESPTHSARNPFGSPSADRAQRVPAIDFGPWLCRPQIEFARWKEEVLGGSATSSTGSRAEKAALRLGRRWRARAASRTTKLSQPSALRNWLCELLLCVPSPDVREAGSALLLRLADPGCCDANESSGLQIADALMLSYLPRAVESGAATSSELFKALATLLLPESRRLYLVARGCLSLLCQLIDAEAARMHGEEAAGAGAPVDLAQGRVLRSLVELLASLLGLKTVRARLRREARLPTLLHALLITRGLVMQRTCHTEEAALRLETLLTSLHDESEDQRSVYIASCVAAMRQHAGGAAVVDAERLAASLSTPDAAAPDPYPHATLQATATRLPDARALTFILAQLCGLVCPERPEPDYALQLNKAPTQEEFIRGAMLKNPYTSRSIGPLMRDVKNRICRDLDMHGLIEDDNGMELLVAGSIIKLDLPVAAVYEQVWAQSAAAQALAHSSNTSGSGPAPGSNGAVAAGTSRASTPPMVVVYRLQGLDGEATEPIIETLGEEQGEDLDPETEFALSAVVGDEGGLELLVALLKRMGVPRAGAQRECASFVFRLLLACCRIRTNRRRVLSIDGIRQLLRLLPQALASQETEGMALQLLQTAGALLEEEARIGGAVAGALGHSSFLSTNAPISMDVEGADSVLVDEDVEWQGFVDHLLNGIERLRRRGDSTGDVGSAEGGDGIDDSNAGCDPAKGLCRAITRVLPLVSRGHPHLVRRIYAHFSPYADFGAYDAANGSAAARHAFMLSCLANILSDPSKRDDIAAGGEAIAAASAAAALKGEAVSAGLAAAGAAYLVRNFPAEKGGASQERWAAALGRPAVAHVLQLLVPLARGATSTGAHDALLAPEVMLRVHTLERQSSSAAKAIGTWAEALLEALREAGQAARVDELRRSTLASKRKAALDKRQRILSSMGMAQAPAAESSSLENGVASGERRVGSGKRRVILSQAHAAMMEELQEESGHICVVCGEGEAYRPGEPLGVYVFTKRVPLPPPFVLPDGGSATPAAARPHEAEGCAATSPSLAMGSCHNALDASSVTEWCHTTVTHFNTIHVRCHREASAAERALKTPKEEWEGATLRNSQTRTNSLWPIWGPSVSAETYASCVDTFWTQAQALGRADAPRLRLLVHNVRLLLLRFACEESFSRDSQGGGRESNLRFVPYMVQMGMFLLDTNGESQRRPYRRSLAMYLEAMEAATEHGAMKDEEVARITSSRDSVLYYLVLSLLAHSLNEWREARLRFLRIAIRHGAEAVAAERVPLGPNPVALSPLVGGSTSALRDGRSPVATSSITSRSPGGRGSGSSRSPLRRVARIELPPSPSTVDAAAPGIGHVGSSSDAPATSSEGTKIGAGSPFVATRPALIFFALIDRFQSMLKEPRSWQPTVSSVDPRSGEAEKEWVSIMRERLQHHDQTLLSEVTSLLRDYETVLLPAASFEEAMDVMGLTSHVLGNGVISATQYVANLQGWP